MKQLELIGFGLTAQEWVDWVMARVRIHVAAYGEVTPDDVQELCERFQRLPPHPSCHGRLWEALRRQGLERTAEERTSRIPSNNARKIRVWRPGPQWGRAAR